MGEKRKASIDMKQHKIVVRITCLIIAALMCVTLFGSAVVSLLAM